MKGKELFGIIEELVKWENTTNEKVLEKAREEIRRSWRLTCEANKDHPQAAELLILKNCPVFMILLQVEEPCPLKRKDSALKAMPATSTPWLCL